MRSQRLLVFIFMSIAIDKAVNCVILILDILIIDIEVIGWQEKNYKP